MSTKRFVFMLLIMLMGVTGAWAEYVPYVDADGIVKYANASEITSTTSVLNNGWYVVKGTDVQTSTLTCNGAVHIIIADGAKLTATSTSDGYAGILVGEALTIYGQTAQTGQLIANGGSDAAGIGGNTTINGGIVTAKGGSKGSGIGGGKSDNGTNITINNGIVTATGGISAAGIGGGNSGHGSNITINGGIVTANGGSDAAGIGGGLSGSGTDITINGGIVTAKGGNVAAGIGGGQNGFGTDITINGGTVTANGGILAAGIGGGQYGQGSNITINSGNVTANGGISAAGIGGGFDGSGSNIFVTPAMRVRADNNNPPVSVIEHSSFTDISSSLNGMQYAIISDQVLFNLRSSDLHKGKVFGVEDGEYTLNTTLRFCAVPTDGYKFKGWSDGNTDNPRQYVLTDDVTITANFEVVFPEPTGTGPRMRVTKTDNKTFEFSVTDVKKVDFNSPN